MVKSNAQIQFEVLKELEWEPSIHHEYIGISVRKGIVTLSGSVPSYIEKSAAGKAAQRVGGVRAVIEDITVRLPSVHYKDDQELVESIINQFNWHSQVPADQIKIGVEHGLVKLAGAVEWEYQRSAAEKCVRGLTGVKGITNSILISSKVKLPVVKSKIEEALKRAAKRGADQLDVKIQDGKVTLSGRVRSLSELKEAEGAAWRAPGVLEVENKLLVSA